MKSINYLFFFIAFCTLLSTACNNQEFETLEVKENYSVDSREPPWWLAPLVEIVIELSQGHHYTKETTTTNEDGEEVTTTESGCKGIGTCKAQGIVLSSGNSLSSDHGPVLTGDFISSAVLGVSPAGNIILGMDDEADPIGKDHFFYDEVIYISPTYTIDNTEVLETFGLEEAIIMHEGNYDVYEEEDFKYIIIQ